MCEKIKNVVNTDKSDTKHIYHSVIDTCVLLIYPLACVTAWNVNMVFHFGLNNIKFTNIAL